MYNFDDIGGFKVAKSDEPDKRIVVAVVYSPDTPDSDNEFMVREDIEKMAHEFLGSGKVNKIDSQHDNTLVQGARVIESFIARKGDPDFPEGSWVVAMKIENDAMWGKIKKGEINGFSIEAMVTKTPMELELDIPPIVNGVTTKSEDHEHDFFVTFDATGNFMGGRTSVEKGHFHNIRTGTVTDTSQDHNHRFSFVENAYQSPTTLQAITKAAADCGVYPHRVDEITAPQELVAEAAITSKNEDLEVKSGKANPTGDKEPDGDADDTKVTVKPKKKFKSAVREAVTEVLKSMGITYPEDVESIQKGGAGSGRHKELSSIAAKHLSISSLTPKNSDRFDFHDVGVSNVKSALHAAYTAGGGKSNADDPNFTKAAEGIASKHLAIPTLTPRNSDSLDFHNVGVANVNSALSDAHALGSKETARKDDSSTLESAVV